MFTSRQMKAARSLLGWNQPKLAAKSGVSLPTISRMELSVGLVGGHARNVYAVLDAFERAGIEFLNGDAPGVRLRKLQ
jgi:transcriptional regulator with XRE-family HTH domain